MVSGFLIKKFFSLELKILKKNQSKTSQRYRAKSKRQSLLTIVLKTKRYIENRA